MTSDLLTAKKFEKPLSRRVRGRREKVRRLDLENYT